MLRVTVLNDNRCSLTNFESEHGLSLFIEYDSLKILFDSGQSDIFIKNAKKLNVDLYDLDYIILSHGDYDHANGLKHLNIKVPLICHPDINKMRISKRTGKYDGINQTKEELSKNFKLVESKNSYNITDNIIFLGEIPRKIEFETNKNLPMITKNNEIYNHLDDSGLVIKADGGIIVISGCAHSGICNTIEYAKKLTKENNVIAVIGGFHLKEIDAQTEKTIEYFQKNNVQHILLAHCTSDIVCEEFKKVLFNETKIIETGLAYEL